MSSSLGFKYTSLTSDIEYNTDFNSPSESREHSRDCGSDYCLDYWWPIPILDFSFFSIKRRRHYKKLNQHIFKPLGNLALIRNNQRYDFVIDDFKFDLTNLPSESSSIYKIALRHMEHDDPFLPQEIEDLKSMMQNHNNLVNETEKQISEIIIDRLKSTHSTPLKTGGTNYSYDFKSVYKYLSYGWKLTTVDEIMSTQKVEDFIPSSYTEYNKTNCYFYFDNVPVGKGTEIEFERMKYALCDIVRNKDILGLLSNLKSSQNNLENQTNSIKKLAKDTVDLIDQELYDTKVIRCCTYYLGFI